MCPRRGEKRLARISHDKTVGAGRCACICGARILRAVSPFVATSIPSSHLIGSGAGTKNIGRQEASTAPLRVRLGLLAETW